MNEVASRALFDAEREVIERHIRLRNWKVYTFDYPLIDIGIPLERRPELRLRVTASNWNDDSVSVELLHANGSPLQAAELPKHPTGVFNGGPHPTAGRPFVCMAGTIEYHTHPSHVNDPWGNYKTQDRFTLAGMLTQLWNAALSCPQ